MKKRRIICFHNPDEPNGYLSNWYPAYFHADGINYSSVEQYMMYQKAILFDDLATAEKIVKTNSAAAMKKPMGASSLLLMTKNGEKHRYRVVYRGVFEKFRQNEGLACQLVNTGDAILAECAVKDIIWGNRTFDERPETLFCYRVERTKSTRKNPYGNTRRSSPLCSIDLEKHNYYL